MIAPSKVIKTLLEEDLIAGGTTGWGLTFSRMPVDPDNHVSVFDVGGSAEPTIIRKDLPGTPKQESRKYGIQVLVRAKLYEVGYTKAQQVRNTIIQWLRRDVVISGVSYRVHCLIADGDLIVLPQQEQERRELFSINALAVIEEL